MRGKRITAWIMALVMTFSVSVYVFAAETTGGQTVVTILHTNDVHGRFVAEEGSVIGVATVAAAKEETPNALLVDAGDAIHGLPFATVSKGADAVKLMDMAGYDVWTPGNHDFNYGYERLMSLVSGTRIDLLSCNITKDGENLLAPTVIKEVAGVKVGFIGVTTRETTYKTAGENIKGLTFEDPIACTKVAVESLKQQNADVIVALVHLGTDEFSEDTSFALADAVPELDVIIDGHSHTFWPEGTYQNGVLIASTGDYGSHLGSVAITLDADRQIIDIAASNMDAAAAAETFTPNATVAAQVDEIKTAQDVLLDEVVAHTADTLSADRSPGVRTQEMPLGNMVADALLTQTGADIAFTNGGGLRATIEAGDITKKNIVACLPFGNFAVTKYITPAILKDLMENGVATYPEASGGFPQIAGFSVAFDPEQPAGSRVVSITYNGANLDFSDNTTKLLLATNDFTAKGGDKYAGLETLDIVTEYSALEEIVIAYLQNTTKTYGAAEGRMTIAEAAVTAAEAETAAPAILVAEVAPISEPAAVLPADDTTECYFPAGATVVVDNCYFLNVRTGSGPSYDAFTYLTKGNEVTVLDYNNHWIQIDTEHGQGWIYDGYVKIK